MKISLDREAPDNTYTNFGFRRNLDEVCQPNEAFEIYCPTILDFIPFAEHTNFINHLLSKLRHGGKLVIGGTDIVSVSLALFTKTLSTEQVNSLLYGDRVGETKRGMTCLEQVRSIVSQHLVIQKLIPGMNFVVEAIRE
jgi:hypothetical protein